MSTIRHYEKTLPSAYKGRGKKVGRVFSIFSPSRGYVDVLISKYKACDDCGRHWGLKNSVCFICKSKNLSFWYTVEECDKDGGKECVVNRWGCNLHRKEVVHGVVCSCEECL